MKDVKLKQNTDLLNGRKEVNFFSSPFLSSLYGTISLFFCKIVLCKLEMLLFLFQNMRGYQGLPGLGAVSGCFV